MRKTLEHRLIDATAEARLKARIEKAVRDTAKAINYYAPRFREMCDRLGPVECIKKLLISSEMHSGFVRMVKADRASDTIESIALEFPELFDETYQACAKFRLKLVKGKAA